MLTSCGNDDSNNEAVDAKHSRHDNGHNGLHNQLWPHDTHRGNAHSGLGCAVRCSKAWHAQQGCQGKASLSLDGRTLHLMCNRLHTPSHNKGCMQVISIREAKSTAGCLGGNSQANTRAAAAPMKPKNGPAQKGAPQQDAKH